MKHPYRILLIVSLVILAVGLVWFITKSNNQDSYTIDFPSDLNQDGELNTQLANPASIYCLNQGGELSVVEEVEGAVGYCVLPERKICEEWAFFNSDGADCIPPEEDTSESEEETDESN